MNILIKDIVVKNRIRKELGDIETLAESLTRYGQISPIVINKKNVLIAGGRRLEAAKRLGWQEINAVIMDSFDELEMLELEVEENKHRKDFVPAEAEDAAKKIHKLRNPSFFRRIWNAIKKFFRKIFKRKK
ncbi:MAG: ParB N-terminal domain-containing protein [Treponema sp.]|jgi:ParB family chromosome partitioning protein|nr:ParB N-terminal domain-containing protein [Treponema sp.]